MRVHLIDGTYELFRHFYALPSATDSEGNEVAAVRGVLGSVVGMLEDGVSHIGVATDHVIESFRNDLYSGYKTGEGIDPQLHSQFGLLEDGLRSLGVTVWPMIEFEADDALATSAARCGGDARVEQVLICTPDKDLAQCVSGERVVQLDRRTTTIRNEAGVRASFGVAPGSIPDYLALVGDSADGFPGLPGWGKKSASVVLARYPHLEDIPRDASEWEFRVRGAERLVRTLAERWSEALLFRTLATLRTDVPLEESVDDLRWSAPLPAFERLCGTLRTERLFQRVSRIAGV
jgi:5'-3' exonuclease